MGKKLYKSKTNKVLCGVCGGIGEFFNIDPTIIRLLTIFLALTSVGVVFYIAAALIMPQSPD